MSSIASHPVARILWIAVGASVGMAVALMFAGPGTSPFLLASLGGSTVFLFGLTRAAAAQPRSLFGGHLGAAFIGIACYQIFGDALWVYVLAQTIAVCVMFVTKTVHPPAGANPILMVHVHASWAVLLHPVLAGVTALAVVAFVWSRLYPKLVHYPVSWWEPNPAWMLWGGWDR